MKIKRRLSMVLCILVLTMSLMGCTDSLTDTVSEGETQASEALLDT